jgi:hypothetical protein
MSELLDKDVRLTIPCGKCGNKYQETIRRLEQGPQITCPRCGYPIHTDADSIRADQKNSEGVTKRRTREMMSKFTTKLSYRTFVLRVPSRDNIGISNHRVWGSLPVRLKLLTLM